MRLDERQKVKERWETTIGMIRLTKFRVVEISAAVVLTLAALAILGWQAWAGAEWGARAADEPQGSNQVSADRIDESKGAWE